MTRAFRVIQFGLVALTLILFGSVATAGPKPKIAILGLEAAVGANGRIDPDDTQFAKDLTKELRSRANNSTSYEPTKDQRELADEKLMNNCGAEHPSCMAPIGSTMGAEAMLFGKIENGKEKGVDGWKVTLKLISVSKKQQIASLPNEFISAKDAKGAGLAGWVKTAYRKLTGEVSEGMLVIKTNANGGNVLVDKVSKETLKSGSANLSLPEGRYSITIDADGFKVFDQDVTISADKPTVLSPTLVKADPKDDTKIEPNPNPGGGDPPIKEREGTVSTNKTKFAAKIIAAVGLGGAAVTGGYWVYMKYWGEIGKYNDTDLAGLKFTPKGASMPLMGEQDIDNSRCGGRFTNADDTDTGRAATANSNFGSACDARTKFKVMGGMAIGLGLVGGAALVYVLVSKDDKPTEHASGKQRKRRNLVVTPVVTPDGTGATLRFDW